MKDHVISFSFCFTSHQSEILYQYRDIKGANPITPYGHLAKKNERCIIYVALVYQTFVLYCILKWLSVLGY